VLVSWLCRRTHWEGKEGEAVPWGCPMELNSGMGDTNGETEAVGTQNKNCDMGSK
jgi:hypothetical protein